LHLGLSCETTFFHEALQVSALPWSTAAESLATEGMQQDGFKADV